MSCLADGVEATEERAARRGRGRGGLWSLLMAVAGLRWGRAGGGFCGLANRVETAAVWTPRGCALVALEAG